MVVGLFEEHGCRACHGFFGRRDARNGGGRLAGDIATSLAPSLDVTRERFVRASLTSWIQRPHQMKHDTVMPELGLSRSEAEALTSYILFAALEAQTSVPLVPRLPLLTRVVHFDEVNERVFHRTCRHCHADGDFALGDGGPGNDGGFGFEGRGLNLTNYEGMAAGLLVDGRRTSVFAIDESGMPRLIRALRARQTRGGRTRGPRCPGYALGPPRHLF